MATTAQVQQGLAKYLDEEFTNKLTGWRKGVFAGGAALVLSKTNSLIDHYKDKEMIKLLGVIKENGEIDMDLLLTHFKPQMPMTFDAPIVGTVTLSASDADKLYRYIVGRENTEWTT